eukprot:jgi/Chlat1/5930/Chrsp4S06409
MPRVQLRSKVLLKFEGAVLSNRKPRRCVVNGRPVRACRGEYVIVREVVGRRLLVGVRCRHCQRPPLYQSFTNLIQNTCVATPGRHGNYKQRHGSSCWRINGRDIHDVLAEPGHPAPEPAPAPEQTPPQPQPQPEPQPQLQHLADMLQQVAISTAGVPALRTRMDNMEGTISTQAETISALQAKCSRLGKDQVKLYAVMNEVLRNGIM